MSGRAKLNNRDLQSRLKPVHDPPRACISTPNIQGRKNYFQTVFANVNIIYSFKEEFICGFKLQKPLTDHHPAAAAAAAAQRVHAAAACRWMQVMKDENNQSSAATAWGHCLQM